MDKPTALMDRLELAALATLAEKHLREKPDGLTGCTSYVQRKLQCGYNRAATLLEILEKRGVITKPDNVGARHWKNP